nr:hypothetical protein [Arenimonas caeni]
MRQQPCWRRHARPLELGLRRGDVGLGALELGLRARRDDPGAQGRQQVLTHALGRGQALLRAPGVGLLALHGGRIGAPERREGLGAEQLFLHAGHERRLGIAPRQAQPAAAGAALLGYAAPVGHRVDHRQRAAALAAAEQAGEQVLRWPARPAALALARALLVEPALHCVPGGPVDDGQLWLLLDHPLGARPFLAQAAPGLRVLDPVRAVPDLLAGVDGVGKDPDAAPAVTVDGRGRPGAAGAGARHAVPVQPGRDRTRRLAGQVLGEDPPHHRRLLGVDHPLARLRAHAVAVGQAAGAGAVERAAHQSAVGLLGQVVEVDLGHQPAQAHVHLVALLVGVDAVADADQAHAGEAKPLHCALHFLAVATEAAKVVDQHHVERRGRGQQALVLGPIGARTADGCVLENHRRRPPHARAVGAAVPQLVLERGLALLVGAVPRIGGDTHGANPTLPGR